MTESVTVLLNDIVSAPAPVVSVSPLVLSAPERIEELRVRVSAPTTGTDLPIILFSHGNGWSLDGYAPLVNYWAAHGFVVIQPTHLDSRRNGIGFEDPRFPLIWTARVDDMKHILDQLDFIEASVPGLAGRVNHDRIAAAGHSWGGQTVGMLLGARVLEANGQPGEDRSDRRVTAGVMLASTGTGGDELNPFAAEHMPFMNPTFTDLTTPTLVVAGDHDQSRMSSRGPDWFTDVYYLSPGATDLLTLFGGEHSLGGIVGYEVAETTDENPERVAVIQALTTAYLESALHNTALPWTAAREAFNKSGEPIGHIDSK